LYDCSPLVPILWLSYPFTCSVRLQVVKSFSEINAFYGAGLSTLRPTPNVEDQGIPFCLDHYLWPALHERPTSSCATAGIVLRIVWPRKPHHYVKVGIPAGVGVSVITLPFFSNKILSWMPFVRSFAPCAWNERIVLRSRPWNFMLSLCLWNSWAGFHDVW
jgi:hypothetical protein